MSPKANTWDARPVYMHYSGQTIEMFYRGALAKALNREVVTIRSMEAKGVLCHPPLKNRDGKWLYTRDQIEDLVRLAKEEGVFDPKYRRQFSNRFIVEAQAVLSRLPQLI